MSRKKTDLLIVDDELAIRGLMAQIFRTSGYTVRCAEDGLAALRLINEAAPAVVLSDLNMPVMSGWELLSTIRRQLPGVYVVAMSGSYTGTLIPDGVTADAFYAKGSSLPDLIQLIADGARWHRSVSARSGLPVLVRA